jgi:hypothetical protein
MFIGIDNREENGRKKKETKTERQEGRKIKKKKLYREENKKIAKERRKGEIKR